MATCLPFRAIPLKPHFTRPAKITCSAPTAQSQLAKQRLLNLIGDQDRGLMTQNNPTKLASIVKAIDDLADLGRDSVTTGGSLSATWRLLWTTEKEQLFIIQNASLFGTQTGDVLQVIDVGQRVLNNVITFPPDGVFFVRSDIAVASNQRVNFKYVLEFGIEVEFRFELQFGSLRSVYFSLFWYLLIYILLYDQLVMFGLC